MRWRPSVGTILLLVNLLILLLPLGSISVLRLYDRELIRQTESELVAQGAFVAAAFRDALLEGLRQQPVPPPGTPVVPYGGRVDPRWEPPELDEPLHPIFPSLELADQPIRPRVGPATQPRLPADPVALAAAGRTLPLLAVAREITLAAIRVVDFRGTVVATTRGELGLSLRQYEEVRRALQGGNMSLLRERVSDEPPPPLSSIRRWSRVRVFVALPVLDRDRVLGAVLLSRSPLSVEKALYENRGALIAAGAALLLIVLVVSLLTSFTLRRPITTLIRQTRQISSGDRGGLTPLAHPGTHEVALLSEAFCSMARTLEARADYIRTFASHVSHEFKTPLTSIRGAVELLRDHLDDMTPAERDRFLQNLDDDAVRLDRLVRRLLELARADMIEPPDDRVQVGEVLERIGQRFTAAGMTVTIECGAGVGSVRMSGETLESILSNLVDNARQHAGEGARVRVYAARRAEREGARVEIGVEDDGPGISEANRARIFAPFFTTARARGGTGLGLAIVRALVMAHGGTIDLETVPVGTRFCIRLPG